MELKNFMVFLFVCFFLYCFVVCRYTVAFTKFLTMYQLYHAWNSSPPLLPFISPPPIHGTVSTGIIAFTGMCTYICTAFTFLPPFPATTPSPLVPMLPTEQGVFHPPVFRFCRRENIKRKT
jgi:hypothetical protein